MGKTLCDWSKKDLEKHADELAKIVRDPRFYCRKCARSAHSSKVLCKPRKLPDVAAE
jgi:hypothetical protein